MKCTYKILAMTLAIMLLVSITSVSLAEDDPMTPFGKYPEKITMTIAKQVPTKAILMEGDTAENNLATRYYLDNYNIEVKVIWEAPEGADYTNKLALSIMSGDIPDLICFSKSTKDYQLFKQMVEEGMLEDLNEAYDLCAADYIKNTVDQGDITPFLGENGERYAIAGTEQGWAHNTLWLRQDWLDAYELEAPTTLDELENILKIWRDNPPTSDYVGLGLNSDVCSMNTTYSASSIFEAFGAYPKTWVTNSDGNVIWGSVAPGMRDGLELLARWYKEGLIDKEFVTRPSSTRASMFVSGMTGAAFAPWSFGLSITDFPIVNATGDISVVNCPVDADGKFNVMFANAPGAFIAVRKGYEHPEAVMKMINTCFGRTLATGEWRQQMYDLYKPALDIGYSSLYMEPTAGLNISAYDKAAHLGDLARLAVEDGIVTLDDANSNLIINVANYVADHDVTKGTNWRDYILRYVASRPQIFRAENMVIHYPAYNLTTESMADLKPNLDTLENSVFVKIVMGDLPIEAFDQFVKDWYAQGGQILTDEVNAALK